MAETHRLDVRGQVVLVLEVGDDGSLRLQERFSGARRTPPIVMSGQKAHELATWIQAHVDKNATTDPVATLYNSEQAFVTAEHQAEQKRVRQLRDKRYQAAASDTTLTPAA